MAALPAVSFQHSYPQYVSQVSASRSNDRYTAFVEYGDGFWQVQMRTKPLKASERLLVEAFRDAAKDGLATVTYTPKHMCIPRAYWGNASAAALTNDGNLSVKDGYDVTVNSVTNGLVLGPGDLISFTTGSYNWMARIITGDTAASNEVDLTLNAPVPAFIATSAVVKFKDIVANMRVVPGSFQMPDDPLPVATWVMVEVPI